MTPPLLKLLRGLWRRGTSRSVPPPPSPPPSSPQIIVLREPAADDARQEAPRRRDLPPDIGDVVDGRFRLMRRIASGGCATVFEATDMACGEAVALKLVTWQDKEYERCIRQEVRALERIQHPNIVGFRYASGPEEHPPYLAMELLRGEELKVCLGRVGRLSVRETLSIIGRGICAGLAAAHEAGVVHADLCPRGVFLTNTEGANEQVKLIDFGLAVVDGRAAMEEDCGMVWGKLRYMSPEQAGGKPIDGRSDLYAVGLILFEALSGRHLLRGSHDLPTIRARQQRINLQAELQLISGVPQALVELLARALAYKPDDRPQSATELGEGLAKIERDLPP